MFELVTVMRVALIVRVHVRKPTLGLNDPPELDGKGDAVEEGGGEADDDGSGEE